MPFLLGTDTVLDYLKSQDLNEFKNIKPAQVYPKLCKNFNLVVEFENQKSLLLKQEPHDADGHTKGDLLNEWRVHQLIDTLTDLNHLQYLISEALVFDHRGSILILRYLTDYVDLESLYSDRNEYPTAIAHRLGATLAEVHRSTCDRQDVKTFLLGENRLGKGSSRRVGDDYVPDFSTMLRPVTPETFGRVTSDVLKFYELVQRYESLGQAIAQLNGLYTPCCLTHSDLKFNNLLVHQDWQAQTSGDRSAELIWDDAALIRIIDWEKRLWGDPAFDLGCLVADYLKRWLKSLMASPDISIEVALQLATTPLERVQPSLRQLVQGYLCHFPEVLELFPDFLSRVMRFAGLALIESLQAHIHYYEPFGNVGICMLQVAKTLLCSPEASTVTVFGQAIDEVLAVVPTPATSPTVSQLASRLQAS